MLIPRTQDIRVLALTVAALLSTGMRSLPAQVPVEAEVRQIVTFSFVPGKAAEAVAVFRERAIPLYRLDEAMKSFRGFREIESSIPLDLMVVSAFDGMAGMDESNASLATIAEEAGTSMGAFYGAIGPLIQSHTDQFIEMRPTLGGGDPSSGRRTAFVWYRVAPGQADAFERALQATVVPWEKSARVPSATGRFLVSDGWDYLRLLAFDSLAHYQDYWSRFEAESDFDAVRGLTAERREVIVAAVTGLSVRE